MIKLKNTPENRAWLHEMGFTFQEEGKFLHHTPNAFHQAFLETGQMTARQYKREVLGF
jgi:hypothetical protein